MCPPSIKPKVVKRLYNTKKSNLTTANIQQAIKTFNNMNDNIKKLSDILDEGAIFTITAHELIDTQFGERQVLTINYNGTVSRCWSVTDLTKLIVEDAFKNIWNDPMFIGFHMKYINKAGNKMLFELLTIKTQMDDLPQNIFE